MGNFFFKRILENSYPNKKISLNKSADRFVLNERVGSGGLIIAVESGKTPRIVLANQAIANLLGVKIDELEGSFLASFIVDGLNLDDFSDTVTHSSLDHRGRRNWVCQEYSPVGLHSSGKKIQLHASASYSEYEGHRIYTILIRDESASQRSHARLARSHEELRQLSAALQTIREQERTYIARELHDDLGQLLAILQMDLSLLRKLLVGNETVDRLMINMDVNLRTALTSLRRIASNLRPRALDDGGLYFALRGLSSEFSDRYKIACSLFADESELQLDDEASTVIFRVIQEALTNIARHADAKNVILNLYRIDGELLVTIRDDGRGILPGDLGKSGSLGLVGMRERVWSMQGEISVISDHSSGTCIDIVIPILDHQL